MTNDPFDSRDPACVCPDVKAQLVAALNGTAVRICAVHQPDQAAARDAEAKAADARDEGDRLRAVRDEVRHEDDLAARRRAKAEQAAEVDSVSDQLELSLRRIVDRRPTLPFPTDGDDAA